MVEKKIIVKFQVGKHSVEVPVTNSELLRLAGANFDNEIIFNDVRRMNIDLESICRGDTKTYPMRIMIGELPKKTKIDDVIQNLNGILGKIKGHRESAMIGRAKGFNGSCFCIKTDLKLIDKKFDMIYCMEPIQDEIKELPAAIHIGDRMHMQVLLPSNSILFGLYGTNSSFTDASSIQTKPIIPLHFNPSQFKTEQMIPLDLEVISIVLDQGDIDFEVLRIMSPMFAITSYGATSRIEIIVDIQSLMDSIQKKIPKVKVYLMKTGFMIRSDAAKTNNMSGIIDYTYRSMLIHWIHSKSGDHIDSALLSNATEFDQELYGDIIIRSLVCQLNFRNEMNALVVYYSDGTRC